MDDPVAPHVCSLSHTQQPKSRKIARPPKAKDDREPKAHLLPWPYKRPVTVVLKYRGGPEGWVEIRARGAIWRRPGVTAIHDVLMDVLGHPHR